MPKARRLCFLTEPPGVKRYNPAYLDQFELVIGAYRPKGYDGAMVTAPMFPEWWYRRSSKFGPYGASWSDLETSTMSATNRSNAVSVVCSDKRSTVQHMRRLRFIKHLRKALGPQLQVYGRGFNPIEDKCEAIDPCRYHLVLENNTLANGWTEKTADAMLGGAYPIIAGPSNLANFFDLDGFEIVDLKAPSSAIATIEKLLTSNEAIEAADAMARNKQRIMHEHQLFPIIARAIGVLSGQGGEKRPLAVAESFQPSGLPKPLKFLTPPASARSRLANAYFQVFER